MRRPAYLAVSVLILACVSAMAQASGTPRTYPTQDGFLEVDPRTGAIRECKRSDDGYRCTRVTAGDPLLKEEIGPPATPEPPRRGERVLGPTEEELDRAIDIMERFLRRLMGIIRDQKPERT